MHIDNIKLLPQNEKELETLIQAVRIYCDDSEMKFDMCHANNEKRKTTNDRRNRTTKSSKNQNAPGKGNLQILENIRTSNKRRLKKKLKKNISWERENYSRTNYIAETLSEG